MSALRYRQVHLDFHTSEAIADIGTAFNAQQFQEALQRGHVDSITVFAKCHHGWHYHPTSIGAQHPHLGFDLLAAQRKAASAIGVRTPVYLSAGLDERLAKLHGGWLRRNQDGSVPWAGTLMKAGFHELCFNTPYLDVLVEQARETTRRYGEHGIFLDIVSPHPCYCSACIKSVIDAGGDPRDEVAVNALGRKVYLNYVQRINEAIHSERPGVGIFHNGGHIPRGDAELAEANPHHLELESLPTGGWGYDHFPLSIAYARRLKQRNGSPKPCLGMTGKFHNSWGEFGGYKHPNALRYEAAAAVAQGSRVSVGDQLHPSGAIDLATYDLIGAAYREVAAKEPWIWEAQVVAEVAVLSLEACLDKATPKNRDSGAAGDQGATQTLLDGHILFDVVDSTEDWSPYKVLLLPDAIDMTPALADRVRAFVANGGKVLASGTSLLLHGQPVIDVGCRDAGECTHDPDYLRPMEPLAPWGDASFVIYAKARALELTNGLVLAHRDEPYFNRDVRHFCSHQHTPPSGRYGGPAVVAGRDGILCAHPLFSVYFEHGTQAVRDFLLRCLHRLLGPSLVTVGMPAAARVFLTRQRHAKRDVVHLLYAQIAVKGAFSGKPIQVIEDLAPLHQIPLTLRRQHQPMTVTLEPQGTLLPFTWNEGVVQVVVPWVECHQMVVFNDA